MSALRKLLFVFPLVAVLALAGCKINTINYFPPNPAPVRVLNLIPDSPLLAVAVEGTVAYNNVGFQGITDYQSFENKITNFSVSIAGVTTPFLQFSANLAGSQPYTLVLTGVMDSPIATLVAEFVNSGSNGNAQVSVYNGAINQAVVDVYVTAPGVDITNLVPGFIGVTYNGATRNSAFGGGTYQIRVTPNGAKGILYDSGPRSLPGNAGVTLVLYSKGSRTLVNAALLQTQGPATIADGVSSLLKTVNAASQTGAVNQFLGSTPVATNVGYPAASVYNEVPPGTQTVNFEATATPGATIASVVGTLGASSDQSVFVTGLPGALQAIVLNDLNIPPISGNVRVRFVNATTGVGPVTIQVDATPQVSGLAAPDASPYVNLGAATVTLTFLDATSGLPLLTVPNVVLTANQTSTVYLTGTPGNVASLITLDN